MTVFGTRDSSYCFFDASESPTTGKLTQSLRQHGEMGNMVGCESNLRLQGASESGEATFREGLQNTDEILQDLAISLSNSVKAMQNFEQVHVEQPTPTRCKVLEREEGGGVPPDLSAYAVPNSLTGGIQDEHGRSRSGHREASSQQSGLQRSPVMAQFNHDIVVFIPEREWRGVEASLAFREARGEMRRRMD